MLEEGLLDDHRRFGGPGQRRRQDEVPVADRGEEGAGAQVQLVGDGEVAEQPADVEGEVLASDVVLVGDEDVLELQLGDGAKAAEAVEDEKDVEQIERELAARVSAWSRP